MSCKSPKVDTAIESLLGDVTSIINQSLSWNFVETLESQPFQWNGEIIHTLLTIINTLIGQTSYNMYFVVVSQESIYPIWLLPPDEDTVASDGEPIWVLSLTHIQRLMYGYDSISVDMQYKSKRKQPCVTDNDNYVITNPIVLEKIAMLVALAQLGAGLYASYRESNGKLDYPKPRKTDYKDGELRRLITVTANERNEEYINNVTVPGNFKKTRVLF